MRSRRGGTTPRGFHAAHTPAGASGQKAVRTHSNGRRVVREGASKRTGRGRADLLLAAGTSRWRFVGSRVVLAVGFVVVLALLAGLAAWASNRVREHPQRRAAGSTSKCSPAESLSVALLALGVWPRATSTVAFGSVGLAYGIQLIGGSISAPAWVLGLFPVHPPGPGRRHRPAAALLVMLALAAAPGPGRGRRLRTSCTHPNIER